MKHMKNRMRLLHIFGTAIIALVVSAFWIDHLRKYAVNIPYWDQWDFLIPVFNGSSVLAQWLYQHGPHRQGLANPLMALILVTTNWNFIAISIASLLIAAAAGLVWSYTAFQMTGSRLWAAAAALPFVSLQISEMVTTNADLSHGPLPALLLSLSVLQIKRKGREIDQNDVFGVLCVVSVFTGFGMFAGFIGIGLMLAMAAARVFEDLFGVVQVNSAWRFLRPLAYACAASLFFVNYRHEPGVDCFTWPQVIISNM